MKKIFLAAIIGILFSFAACNDDGAASPADGDTKTAKQDTVPASPEPADTTVIDPPHTPEPIDPAASYFSQADLELIAALKALIPPDVLSGFEERYSAWEATWYLPEVATSSRIRAYAQSEEYDELLSYCGHYGKASWPLLIDKLAGGNVFTGNLLEDLTYTGEERLGAYIRAKYLSVITGPSSNELLAIYSSVELLAQEEEHIRKAIRDIPAADDADFEVDITVSGQDILISISSATDTGTFIKVQDYVRGNGGVVHAAGYDVSKGNQTFAVNRGTFPRNAGPEDIHVPHVVLVYIAGKVICKRVVFQS
jgi:hypothetical protein